MSVTEVCNKKVFGNLFLTLRCKIYLKIKSCTVQNVLPHTPWEGKRFCLWVFLRIQWESMSSGRSLYMPRRVIMKLPILADQI